MRGLIFFCQILCFGFRRLRLVICLFIGGIFGNLFLILFVGVMFAHLAITRHPSAAVRPTVNCSNIRFHMPQNRNLPANRRYSRFCHSHCRTVRNEVQIQGSQCYHPAPFPPSPAVPPRRSLRSALEPARPDNFVVRPNYPKPFHISSGKLFGWRAAITTAGVYLACAFSLARDIPCRYAPVLWLRSIPNSLFCFNLLSGNVSLHHRGPTIQNRFIVSPLYELHNP
jgi:hypothetical protein